MPKVSIIVPVYNYEMYLERCLDSLMSQTLKDIEIIIVDDGSTDGTPELADKIAQKDERIRVIHKKNGGLSDSRNVGIEEAKGEYIGFVDADDWVDKSMYEKMYDICINNNADLCSSRYAIVQEYGEKVEKLDESIHIYEGVDKIKKYFQIGLADRSNQYSACIKLYKKSLFDSIKFPLNTRFEDMITNLYVVEKANKFIIYNCNLYYYYMNSVSITRNKFSKRDLDLIKVTGQMYNHVKETELRNLGRCIYGRAYFSLLLKGARYGFDESIENPKEMYNKLHLGFKKHYNDLIHSNMPANRKIIMPFLKMCPNLVAKCFSVYRSIKHA